MKQVNCKTSNSKVVVQDNRYNETIEHNFVEDTERLNYLGPFDQCPKDIASIACDFSGKPVR